ncbi:protein-L-isoaspartate(D-aspartate) O-methyltransferase [Rubinisphaera sp.]|uniref:protein-L-isoaspartate(D-aspartate) O-methyltransferase n=1 Tax=Rubinisphaera sp. TaxID=2024857 RepID=UPI000C0E7BA8|nr:protein-L-isoaspartate(D-aspartate) O-methyltransferase [Rubinisphaera sp.]MBV09455.1 protein-L-isoaspartate O-methyltransferase [Rubinisphaera sp.]HCS52830.1 protein-L-isoaspartate O-methyltransferase [Planctomycetaceae bacterium]|tara:strand:- start:8403 stop:9035 length:633 start_codon:yes stop_codon:yes gene_type:complete
MEHVQELIETLKQQGIRDERVLKAMQNVPREIFLPENLKSHAYENRALPIDCDQTISQPYIVALMTQALQLQSIDRVLEIGTGSGYQTAILSQLCKTVYTVERWEELGQIAQERFRQLELNNIETVFGDGTLGWPEHAPYDAIIVTAATPSIPSAYFEQLTPGKRLVIPVGGSEAQELILAIRDETGWECSTLCGCRFVKLIGEQGWKAD